MGSTLLSDPGARNALRAYERSRWRLAFIGFAPALLVPIVVLCWDGLSLRTLLLGGALFAAGVVALWRGQDMGRGVGIGVVAGLIPLLASMVAPRLHVCTGSMCMSVCAAAAAGGGLAAGIVVGRAWRSSHRGALMLIAAGTFSMLTGAIGCACLGYLGLVGMGAGLVAGVLGSTMLIAPRRDPSNKAL